MKIALVFIFLCIYGCWVNGKFIHPAVAKQLNGNAKAFLQKYLQPIHNIAQQFPDRAIEVQLEVSQDKPSLKPNKLPMPLLKSPIRTVHKMHRVGGDNNSNKNVHRRYILPADFYNLGDDDEEYAELDVPILKAKKEEKPTTAKAKAKTTTKTTKATTKKATTKSTNTKSTTKATTKTTTKASTTTHETTTTAAPTYPDPGKKPVYMDDLVNALSEFENKIMATTTFEPKLINEGNRPLLKKDLWLALGMNQANCQPALGSMVADYNLEDLDDEEPEAETPKRDNTNLDIIMNLLKRGVRIQHDAPNLKENQNLQWFQVKVPKT